MTTTQNNITKDMTPVEAASLLAKLEAGHQAAWLATHEATWPSAEHESRFKNAAEADAVFRDLMWETVRTGMRHPGEPVEEFADRVGSQAWLAEARKAGAQTTADPIVQQANAGMTPERAGDSQDEIAARLLNDPATPEGKAYARASADTAAAYVKKLRERDPLPEPDRTPGTPHPDPFLAGRGWQMNKHGTYVRKPQPQAGPQPEKEPEAG